MALSDLRAAGRNPVDSQMLRSFRFLLFPRGALTAAYLDGFRTLIVITLYTN
ncbi:MAG: hypothetical protein ABIT36_10365 [Steroidobacteraceae bacterium]